MQRAMGAGRSKVARTRGPAGGGAAGTVRAAPRVGGSGGREGMVTADSTLARAQAGDGGAFEALVAPHRRELLAHCYRMLGSLQDAEDVLQETLVAAWESVGRFDGRSLRAWLYRIATNRCANHRRDASRRPQPAGPPRFPGASPSDEPWWLQPYPDALLDDPALGPEARYDARESIALSFVAALQRLPGRQRAVLVLRDVLGFSASEVAAMLDASPAAVHSALQRARAGLPPGRDPDAVPLPRSRAEAAVVQRFVDAFQGGDIDGVVALLTADARVTMPPAPIEVHGRPAVAAFYRTQPLWGQDPRLVLARANGQPACAYYLRGPGEDIHRAGGVLVLSVVGDRIAAIVRFGGPDLFSRFGLPAVLPHP